MREACCFARSSADFLVAACFFSTDSGTGAAAALGGIGNGFCGRQEILFEHAMRLNSFQVLLPLSAQRSVTVQRSASPPLLMHACASATPRWGQLEHIASIGGTTVLSRAASASAHRACRSATRTASERCTRSSHACHSTCDASCESGTGEKGEKEKLVGTGTASRIVAVASHLRCDSCDCVTVTVTCDCDSSVCDCDCLSVT